MILNALAHAARDAALAPEFARAIEFLRRPDLAALPVGKVPIDGDRLFALIQHGPGKPRSEARLEAHRRYIDIQYVIAGADDMGWSPVAACRTPAAPFNTEKDIGFYLDAPEAWIRVQAGRYIVFFPEDAHAPSVADGVIHKVVLKVETRRPVQP